MSEGSRAQGRSTPRATRARRGALLGSAAAIAVLFGFGCGSKEAVIGNRVVLIDVAQERSTVLTHDVADHSLLGWSPDGRVLSWATAKLELSSRREVRIELASREGLGPPRAAIASVAAEPPPTPVESGRPIGWSRHGTVAFLGRDEVVLLEQDGTLVRRVGAPGATGEAAWSDDGRRLAFVENTVRRAGVVSEYSSTLVVTDERGHTLHRLRAPGLVAGPLSWSPDGNAIALSASQDRPDASQLPGASQRTRVPAPPSQPQYELTLVRPEERVVRRVTPTPADELVPQWAPDGRRILVTRRAAGRLSLWTFGADGRSPRRLTGELARATASWSPDGRAVLVNGTPTASALQAQAKGRGAYNGLYLVSANGGHLRPLAAEVAPATEAWSRDGSWIAFARYAPDVPYATGRLTLIRPDGSARHEVAVIPGANIETVAWSPDGRRIALTAGRARQPD